MNRFFKTAAMALMLLAAASCEKDIPVNDIRIEPSSATLFVGESIGIDIQYFPEDATNTDELTVYSSNERILSYNNGIVTAKDAGSAAITAACGSVMAQCRIKVYKDFFTKGDIASGIDYGAGYLNYESESEPQSVYIDLIHEPSSPGEPTQTFEVYLRCTQLGKDLDFTQPLADAFVSVFANNTEDGYSVFAMLEEEPLIVTADFSRIEGLTLVKGLLRVDQTTANRYKIHADFELSNGYRFNVDWEGLPNLKMS